MKETLIFLSTLSDLLQKMLIEIFNFFKAVNICWVNYLLNLKWCYLVNSLAQNPLGTYVMRYNLLYTRWFKYACTFIALRSSGNSWSATTGHCFCLSGSKEGMSRYLSEILIPTSNLLIKSTYFITCDDGKRFSPWKIWFWRSDIFNKPKQEQFVLTQ